MGDRADDEQVGMPGKITRLLSMGGAWPNDPLPHPTGDHLMQEVGDGERGVRVRERERERGSSSREREREVGVRDGGGPILAQPHTYNPKP